MISTRIRFGMPPAQEASGGRLVEGDAELGRLEVAALDEKRTCAEDDGRDTDDNDARPPRAALQR